MMSKICLFSQANIFSGQFGWCFELVDWCARSVLEKSCVSQARVMVTPGSNDAAISATAAGEKDETIFEVM